MVFSLLQPSLWRKEPHVISLFRAALISCSGWCDNTAEDYRLTCAYSPRPGRRPVGRGHVPAAGSDTAPGSLTWPCGLWRSYSWWSALRSVGDRPLGNRNREQRSKTEPFPPEARRYNRSEPTSAACHKISTFLLFLALTFWLSRFSSSGRLVGLWEQGRAEESQEEQRWREGRDVSVRRGRSRLTVFRQDLFKLVVIGLEASHALHVDHVLQRCVSKPGHTQRERDNRFGQKWMKMKTDATLFGQSK